MSWRLMNEVTMDLTSVASFSVSDGVKDHFLANNILVFGVDLQVLDQVGELHTYHHELL